MRHLLIGTAGHIDHGKTALIRALTGIDTDRLPEEKRRGITVDLGFAQFELPGGVRAGIVDVPGHERYVKNMLAGAGAADLALMVVAADEGVMPQTREHRDILSLLGVRHGVVALTRCDLADAETLALAREDVREAFVGTFLEDAPVVAVSSLTGEGLDSLRAALAEAAQAVPERPAGTPFYLTVDRAFAVKGFGTVVTGTVLAGTVRPGDLLTVCPSGVRARVRGLECGGTPAEAGVPGQRLAVNLAGIEAGAAARGEALCALAAAGASRMLDVRLQLLAAVPPLRHNAELHLSLGTACVLCRAALPGAGELASGGSGYARLRLAEPVYARPGDRYVLRGGSPLMTLGGGAVLDASPKRRRLDAAWAERLQCYETGSLSGRLRYEAASAPLTEERVRALFRHLPETEVRGAIAELLAEGGLRAAGQLLLTPALRDRLEGEARRLLEAFHAAHPLETGMPLAALRERLPEGFADWLCESGRIVRRGAYAALPGFSPEETTYFCALAERLRAVYREAGTAPPAEGEAARLAGLPAADALRVSTLLEGRGELIRLTPGLLIGAEAFRAAREAAREAACDGRVTLAGLRDALGTSRRYAQALLEAFDARGLTVRDGEFHRLSQSL